MASETELLYLVAFVVLMLIIQIIVTAVGPERDGKSHR